MLKNHRFDHLLVHGKGCQMSNPLILPYIQGTRKCATGSRKPGKWSIFVEKGRSPLARAGILAEMSKKSVFLDQKVVNFGPKSGKFAHFWTHKGCLALAK